MTEVRWFLSIQFSKSLIPWRAYQSRVFQAFCQALLRTSNDAAWHPSHPMWERNHTEAGPSCQPLTQCFLTIALRPVNEALIRAARDRQFSARRGGRRGKEGGRVPRQGRHVLEGTLDRMEGASLRGPETLPPWNLVFKWSDTRWYHSLGPEACPPCTSMMDRNEGRHNPSSEGIS